MCEGGSLLSTIICSVLDVKSSSNSKFAGNFKKTSTGKIVVKNASGNEIQF